MVSLSDLASELAAREQPTTVLRDAIRRGSEVLAPAASRVPTPLVQYQRDIVGFAVQELGIPIETIVWSLNEGFGGHVWDGTEDPLVAVCRALEGWEDVGVESATGTGKSFFGAVIVLWFVAVWPMARAFTFAPKAEQLKLYIWKEITRLWPKFRAIFPDAELTTLRIRMIPGSDEWGAWGYSVAVRAGETSATSAQGMHAEHMLLMYEETPGIAYPVIEAGENTCTSPHNVRVAWGNPDHQLDGLHLFSFDEMGKARPGVRHVRISALDHPNVVTGREIVTGAVGRKRVRKAANKYRIEYEGVTDAALRDPKAHRMFNSRVRGISPAEAADALIKLEWIQAANARWMDEDDKRVLMAQGRRALGVDVANSEDGDEAAIARGKGAYLEEVPSFPCPNANTLGLKVHIEMRDEYIADENVGVDSVGVGVGCVNELKSRDRYIRALNGGESPIGMVGMDETFNNLRSQIHWVLAEDLRLGKIALPPDPELTRDLITPTYETKNGKIVVESKETIMERMPGRRSPNKGDAAAYWNFVRDREPVVSTVPKKHLTRAQRLAKELEDLDRAEEEHNAGSERFGSVMRQ